MVLDNNKIRKDLIEIERKSKSKINIFIYCLIICLFTLLLSFSIVKSIEVLDTLASLLCKISIFSFSLILVEGLIVALIEYRKRDFYIAKNLWKVIENNLTNKIIEGKKYIFEFTGGYSIYVNEELFNSSKIGERFYLVVKNKPCSDLIKHRKKVFTIYKKSDYLTYSNHDIEQTNSIVKPLNDKNIRKTLFLYNLPDFLEIVLIAISISTGIGTIFQILKQQYLTYLQDSILLLFVFILFVVAFICLHSLKRKKIKHILFNQCILVEDKMSYSLIAKYENKYTIIKIFSKEDFLDCTNSIKKKRDF